MSEGKFVVVLFSTKVEEPPPSRLMALITPNEMSNAENSCRLTPNESGEELSRLHFFVFGEFFLCFSSFFSLFVQRDKSGNFLYASSHL